MRDREQYLCLTAITVQAEKVVVNFTRGNLDTPETEETTIGVYIAGEKVKGEIEGVDSYFIFDGEKEGSNLIFFLPLFVKPNSQYGRFHSNQALLLLITAIGINIVGTILPFIGWFLILPFGFIFTFVLFIMGIINAVNGKKKRLPLIGGFDIIK